MTSDTNDTVAIEDWETLRGVNSGAKAETRAGLWVLDRLRDEIETTNRLYSTP